MSSFQPLQSPLSHTDGLWKARSCPAAAAREEACRPAAQSPNLGRTAARAACRQAGSPLRGSAGVGLGTALGGPAAPTGYSRPILSFDSRGGPTLETFNRRTASGGCSGGAERRALAQSCRLFRLYQSYARRRERCGRIIGRRVIRPARPYAAWARGSSLPASWRSADARMRPSSPTSSNRTDTRFDTPDSCMVTP